MEGDLHKILLMDADGFCVVRENIIYSFILVYSLTVYTMPQTIYRLGVSDNHLVDNEEAACLTVIKNK